MSLNATLLVRLQPATLTATNGLGLATVAHTLSKTYGFTDGSGANQANKIWTGAGRVIQPTPGDETLNLADGSLSNSVGAVIFTKVKVLIVLPAAENTNDLHVGGATNAVPFFGAADDYLVMPPSGGVILVAPGAAGWPISSGADELKVANSGAGSAVTYDIVLIGA